MKTNYFRITALFVLLLLAITTVHGQIASITLVDANYTYNSDYQGSIYCVYYNNGSPIPLAGSVAVGGLNQTSLNPFTLTWILPVDTEENVYILKVYITKLSLSQNSNPYPASSAWFNTYYYYNNTIPVTVRF